jgi:hypothetical protein
MGLGPALSFLIAGLLVLIVAQSAGNARGKCSPSFFAGQNPKNPGQRRGFLLEKRKLSINRKGN